MVGGTPVAKTDEAMTAKVDKADERVVPVGTERAAAEVALTLPRPEN
jgi:hypothetical protein